MAVAAQHLRSWRSPEPRRAGRRARLLQLALDAAVEHRRAAFAPSALTRRSGAAPAARARPAPPPGWRRNPPRGRPPSAFATLMVVPRLYTSSSAGRRRRDIDECAADGHRQGALHQRMHQGRGSAHSRSTRQRPTRLLAPATAAMAPSTRGSGVRHGGLSSGRPSDRLA